MKESENGKKIKIPSNIKIVDANEMHFKYAEEVCRMIEESANIRGTGIAKRKPEYIRMKMKENKAVIALENDSKVVGFCYIETWEHQKFVVHSGLIVHLDYRQLGLAKEIKKKVFELSRRRFPDAKIFGLTTSLAVMKINSELGYKPVTFQLLTQDDDFWKGCESCVNYEILQGKERKMCLCTGMLYEPEKKEEPSLKHSWKAYDRWLRLRNNFLLKSVIRIGNNK